MHCRCGRTGEIPARHAHFSQGNPEPHPKPAPRHTRTVRWLGHPRLETAGLDAASAQSFPRRSGHGRHPAPLPRTRGMETPAQDSRTVDGMGASRGCEQSGDPSPRPRKRNPARAVDLRSGGLPGLCSLQARMQILHRTEKRRPDLADAGGHHPRSSHRPRRWRAPRPPRRHDRHLHLHGRWRP